MDNPKKNITYWFTKSPKAGRRRLALISLAVIVIGLGAFDFLGPPGGGAEYIAKPLIRGYHYIPEYAIPFSCPAEPSCSEYAYDATRNHGLVLGAVLTADRLIHEQGRLKEGPWVEMGDKKKLFDPPPDQTSFPLLFTTERRLTPMFALPGYGKAKSPDEGRYKMGWQFLALGHWQGAKTMFLTVKPESKYGAKAAWLVGRLGTGSWPEPKTAAWPGWFSVVPGLGQLWLKRPIDAAWAAGLTLGLGGAAVACLAVGSVVGTVIFGLPALAFYFGNIHNSLSSVARTNELDRRAYLAQLKNGVAAIP